MIPTLPEFSAQSLATKPLAPQTASKLGHAPHLLAGVAAFPALLNASRAEQLPDALPFAQSDVAADESLEEAADGALANLPTSIQPQPGKLAPVTGNLLPVELPVERAAAQPATQPAKLPVTLNTDLPARPSPQPLDLPLTTSDSMARGIPAAAAQPAELSATDADPLAKAQTDQPAPEPKTLKARAPRPVAQPDDRLIAVNGKAPAQPHAGVAAQSLDTPDKNIASLVASDKVPQRADPQPEPELPLRADQSHRAALVPPRGRPSVTDLEAPTARAVERGVGPMRVQFSGPDMPATRRTLAEQIVPKQALPETSDARASASGPLPDLTTPGKPTAQTPAALPPAPSAGSGAEVPLQATAPTSPAAPAPAAPAPAAPVPEVRAESRPFAQVENAIEQLVEARETGRAARPELTLRHSEFGAVNMRIEALGTDLRATVTARDPGFVPAIQAALAERGVAASSDTSPGHSQRGHDQSSGQQNSHAGSSGHGLHSEGRYGTSTGWGQASPQPYFDQNGANDEEAAMSGRAGADRSLKDDPRQTGLFA